jgi:hypothetical protein
VIQGILASIAFLLVFILISLGLAVDRLGEIARELRRHRP